MKQTISKYFTFTVSLVLFLCSCTSETEEEPKKRVLQFAAVQNDLAEENNEEWAANDQIGVYTTLYNTTNILYNDNVLYRSNITSGSNSVCKFVPDSVPATIPDDDTRYNIIAYHPYNAAAQNGVISLNLSDQSNQESLDIITARLSDIGINDTFMSLKLKFTHRLSKFTITLITEDGTTPDDFAATISAQPCDVKYDIISDKLTANFSISPQTVNMHVSGNTASAILLPNSIDGNPAMTRQVKYTYNGITETKTLPADIVFEPGKQYDVTITPQAAGNNAPAMKVVCRERS